MIGRIFLLTTLALAQGNHIEELEGHSYIISDRCPAQGHFLLPHEYDCTKFYYCEYGVKWVTPRDCSPGTEFSYELQVCVHPAQANCNLSGTPPDSEESTEAPTEPPTEAPTEPSTEAPTEAPNEAPTEPPTEAPTVPSTETPTERPTESPTEPPTESPTITQTEPPTVAPTEPPTKAPTEPPTVAPIEPPTDASTEPSTAPPTQTPVPIVTTEPPTDSPTEPPTEAPTEPPTVAPTEPPTEAPTEHPSVAPTEPPTEAPTVSPTESPTEPPTEAPTEPPTVAPTEPPTETPTEPPTEAPTEAPTGPPTEPPTESPTEPSTAPPTQTPVPITTEAPTETPEPTTLPTEKPESGRLPNGCPTDFQEHLLLPHETECNKFYYCDFGEKVERECAPGTNFNPTIQVCDWPANVNCSNSNSGENGNSGEDNGKGDNENENGVLPNGCPADFDVHQLLPHESDCGKFYYCVQGGKVESECSDGLLFNPAIQVCDWPANVNCSNSNSGENGNSAEDGIGDNGSGDNENGVLPNGCPADFDVHQLLPHESDCGKFYYCVQGGKVESECSDGLLFNPAIQVCDWPANVNCSNSNSGENGNGGEDNGSGDNGSGDNENENDVLPNGCPADFDVHQLLPHESDCGKFYYCVQGDKVERDCSEGLLFNPAIQVCDWPANVDCPNSNSGENNTNSAEDNGSGDNGSGDNGSADNENENGVLPNGCPADFDVHQLLPHESDCGKFYYCVQGEKVERECSDDLLFNPAIQVCDWPVNVNCSNSNSGENGNNGEDNGSGENENGVLPNGCPADFDVHQLLPHESDCGKFYYCVQGGKVESECSDGLLFNPAIQVCDWPANVDCSNSNSGENNTNSAEDNGSGDNGSGDNGSGENGSGDNENENGVLPNGCPADFDVHQLLPHESECGKFYYCVQGEKVESECSDGLLFNPAIQVCDWPANVDCSNSNSGENNTNSAEDNGSGDNGSGENGSGDNGSGDSGSGDNENENGVLPNGCPADFDVHQLLPHESDCGKFYYCVQGGKVESECSDGLLFNPAIQVCDWPANVDCSNSNSGENNTNSAEDNGSGDNGSGDNGSGDNGSGDNGSGDNGSGDNENENGVLPNGCPVDFDVHQLLPHESDCAKFYYCVHGEKVERDCGAGTHFNPTLQVCDWPENAGCAAGSGENGNSEESTEGSGSAENGSGENGSGENGSGENGSGENGNGEESAEGSGSAENDSNEDGSGENGSGENGSNETGSGENDSGENGNEPASEICKTSCNIAAWAHEHDCDKYWRCDGENSVLGICSEGLHFNVNTQTCDFICNAGCVRDDVQSTPEHDGLKLFLPWDKVDSTIRKLYLTGHK